MLSAAGGEGGKAANPGKVPLSYQALFTRIFKLLSLAEELLSQLQMAVYRRAAGNEIDQRR